MRYRKLLESSFGLVYHGTMDAEIKELVPRYSELVDDKVVYAAKLFDVAVSMANHWNDDDFEFGRHGPEDDQEFTPYTMKELIAGSFEKYFSDPITVYLLSDSSFVTDENLQDFELISKEHIRPLNRVTIENPLDYLRVSPFVTIIPKN